MPDLFSAKLKHPKQNTASTEETGKKLKPISKHFFQQTKKKQTTATNIKTFMNIQVLGTGCPKCKSLEKATREVVAQNNK